MTIEHTLEALAPTLSEGESCRCVCPVCHGGRTEEISATASRLNGVVVWKCWRASCNKSGKLLTTGIHTAFRRKKSGLTYGSYPITDAAGKLLLNSKVKSNTLREASRWTPSYGGRFVFPVMSRHGARVGAVLRSYDAAQHTKALTDTGDYKGCAWFSDSPLSTAVIITEDIVSAALCFEHTGIATCALLGADVTEDKMLDILACRPALIVVCLDEDALPQAISVVSRLRTRTAAVCSIIGVSPDIKDMNNDQLSKLRNDIEELI